MLNEDCYQLLGITPDADEKTIRRAYRDRSKELHPDVNPAPNAAQQFAKLSAAQSTLLDPVSRLKHDDHFGYNKTTRNQDKNAKQQYSTFQKEKAEHLVKEWSSDYDKAMGMREFQRMEHLEKHKRKMRMITLLLIAIITLVAGFVAFVFMGGN